MSWRTFDSAAGKTQDYPLYWNTTTESLEIVGKGWHAADNPPVDGNGVAKNPLDELDNIITADGRGGRRVITINDRFIGPTIKVREGAIVKVIVNNMLPMQEATVHWHGLYMTDNFWMDGANGVNQCGIRTYHNFTYVWRAEDAGTYWYHSHDAIQRMDGLAGGIIIYHKDDQLEVIENDIPLILFDYYDIDAIQLISTDIWNHAGTTTFLGTAEHHCSNKERAYEHGVKVSGLCMDSLTINSFGQYRNHNNASDAEASIKQTYHVPSDTTTVKFRVVHAGHEFSIRLFRLDGEPLTVIATDGFDMIPIEVTEIIVGIGETFDIVTKMNPETTFMNIRGQLLAQCKGIQCDPTHVPYVDVGISRDANNPATTTSQTISLERPDVPIEPVSDCVPDTDGECYVFNCPFADYGTDISNSYVRTPKTCKYIHEAQRDTAGDSNLPVAPPMAGEIPDKIINMTFNFAHGSSVNNMKFDYPKVPLYHDESLWGINPCPDVADVPTAGIKCTQILTADVGDLVELRFVAAEYPGHPLRTSMRTFHTVHMHGNDFYLTHVGFPQTFPNGTISGINENIKCINDACTMQEWDEEALKNSEVNGPYIGKNTFLLPAEGYTIVRFRASNPGYWPLHCHNTMHNFEGMMVLFNVRDPINNRPFSMIPNGLPSCAVHKPSDMYPWEERANSEPDSSNLNQLSFTLTFLSLAFSIFQL